MSGDLVSRSVYRLDELREANIQTPRAIVNGLIHEGETILLVGRPKVGKSRLIQQLALCLSRGEPFLGHDVPERCGVLLLDLENRPAGVKKRFSSMSEANEADSRIFVYAPETLASEQFSPFDDGFTRLYTLVEDLKPEVLIIDTWRLFVGGDENKADTTVSALKALTGLRKAAPGLVTIVVHHLRKEKPEGAARLRTDPYAWVETVSGHHALVGHVDACYGLDRQATNLGDDCIVFGGVARNNEPPVLLLEDDEDSLRFRVTDTEAALKLVLTDTEEKLYNVAMKMGTFTFTGLVAKANTTNRKAVSKMLKKAESHGRVTHDGPQYTVIRHADSHAFMELAELPRTIS